MAAPTKALPRPGRTLAILAALVLALGVWTFWPGESHTPKLGLDLRGGTQVILTPKAAEGDGQINDDQLAQTVEIIRQRVDGFGVAESEVTTQGSGQNATIIVSIPGVTNQAILDSLATTAKLDFRPVLAVDFGSPQPVATPSPSVSGSVSPSPSASVSPSASASVSPSPSTTVSPSATGNGAALTGGLAPAATTPSPSASASVTPSSSASPSPVATGTLTTQDGLPPIQSPANDAALQQAFVDIDCSATGATQGGPVDPKKYLATCATDGSLKYLLDPAAVQGIEIASASAGLSQSGGAGWEVNLTFTSAGAQQFATVTGQLAQNQPPQNQFGIVLDGLVQSAPSVETADHRRKCRHHRLSSRRRRPRPSPTSSSTGRCRSRSRSRRFSSSRRPWARTSSPRA